MPHHEIEDIKEQVGQAYPEIGLILVPMYVVHDKNDSSARKMNKHLLWT